MRFKTVILCTLAVCLVAAPLHAFLEDLCLPRKGSNATLQWCVRPTCAGPYQDPNAACPQQTADFITIMPGRSMIHADSTYFIAQALGYRADVAYWIAAYNENADYSQYLPIDQCGVMASTSNSGKSYITAYFNGFLRTSQDTDGPLDHYVVNFSPNGTGTDVHGPQGVSGVYPLHYPKPGYPVHIDDVYQKTLANLRQWGMLKTTDPGVLCTVGLTEGDGCLETGRIIGTVPFFLRTGIGSFNIDVPVGKKVLNYTSDANGTKIDTYDQLQNYLNASAGRLWKSSPPVPVPVQVARIALYLHVLQDSSSHATYCGDDPPSAPGGCDPGTYMWKDSDGNIQLSFGNGCANKPHIAGHVQETGSGSNSLPLRDYVALNNTVDELIVFGNQVALDNGWIVNRELLPPDVTGGKSAQGKSASDLKAELVGTIKSGSTPAYSGTEVYNSGVVALPLQQTNALDRLHAMNSALANYSNTVRGRSGNPTGFVAFEQMPGNSAKKDDQSVCWK